MSQTESILNHLKEHGTINPIQALNLYGSFRLGARISDLRQSGVRIETKMIYKKNGVRYAEYHLGEEQWY